MNQDFAAPCPLYKKCGGCQYQSLPYPEQLHRKMAREIALLGKFGHVEPILGMENPTHYRNKVCAAFGLDAKKHIVSGVYHLTSALAAVSCAMCWCGVAFKAVR